jgi:hypothetical protein
VTAARLHKAPLAVDTRTAGGRLWRRMRLTPHPRRVFATLAAVALVLASIAAAFQRSPAHAAGFVDPVLGLVSVCASDGSSTVPQDGGGQQPHLLDHCPLCTLLTPIALPGAGLPETAIVFAIGHLPALSPRGAQTLADHLGPGGIRSRAPPLRA